MQRKGKLSAAVCKRSSGQNIVETALVLPVLLILLALVVDGGRAYYRYMQLQHVVRDAAFYGAVHGGDVSAAEATARSAAADMGLDLSSLDVEATDGSERGEEYIVVRASYRMNTILLGMVGYSTFVLRDGTKAMILRESSHPGRLAP